MNGKIFHEHSYFESTEITWEGMGVFLKRARLHVARCEGEDDLQFLQTTGHKQTESLETQNSSFTYRRNFYRIPIYTTKF